MYDIDTIKLGSVEGRSLGAIDGVNEGWYNGLRLTDRLSDGLNEGLDGRRLLGIVDSCEDGLDDTDGVSLG